MTDPVTTNGGPVKVPGRFRGVVGSLPPRLFGGAIGEGFGEWLGGRWGLGGGRPPSPARRVFRKEKGRAPAPGRRPAVRPARFSNYQLNATLRLTLNHLPPVPAPEAGAADSTFVPAAASLAVARGNGAAAAGLLSRESWTSFRLLSERLRETARLSSRERTLKILFGGGGAALVAPPAPGPAGRTKGGGAPARPSFAEGPPNFLPGATRRWARLFSESLNSTVLRHERGGVEPVPGAGVFISLRPVLRGGGAKWQTLLLRESVRDTRAGGPGAREQLATLLRSARKGVFSQTLATRPSATTALRLTFAAQRSSEAKAEAPGWPRAAPALSLQFARQVGASARGVAEALRGRRPERAR